MAHTDLHPSGTAVAVRGKDSDETWLTGMYSGPDQSGLHTVMFPAIPPELVEADRIRGPGQIYIDSRGVAMAPMTFGEALEAVHQLASDHQPAGNDDPANEELSSVLAWQRAALETMEDLVVNHHDRIDDTYKLPVACGSWPEAEVGCRRDLDPANPVDALRICLELGETGIPKHSSRDPEEADAIDRAHQACDLVRDLIGAHGRDLGTRITVVPGPRG